VTIELAQAHMQELQKRVHSHCVVCGRANGKGMHLDFRLQQDGSVQAIFDCPRDYQGYPDYLHGGVLAAMLDGAMTHWLFARKKSAVTAELNIRYRHPVSTDQPAIVRAKLEQSHGPLHLLRAEIIQVGKVKVTANGKFYEQPTLDHAK
jgi:acyl-coenzyme A thioesterase PaaI-like protein